MIYSQRFSYFNKYQFKSLTIDIIADTNMQQKVKDVFELGAINDAFSRELYKKVRNSAKKLDNILKTEERLKNKEIKSTSDIQEKLSAKQALSQQVDEIIAVYKMYQKALPSKETSLVAENVETQDYQQQHEAQCASENKVVECQILKPKEIAQTATKETQSQSSSAQKETQAEIKTANSVSLDTPSANIDEALRMVSALFHIGTQNQYMQMALSTIGDNLLTQQDLGILNRFWLGFMFNPQCPNLESKVAYSSQMLQALLQSGNNQIAFENITYSDVKRALEKAMTSQKVMRDLLFMPFIPGMIMQDPTLGINPLAMAPPTLAPAQMAPTIVQSPLEQQYQQRTQEIPQYQRVSDTPPKKQVETYEEQYERAEQNTSPMKDMSKSPHKQPGAYQEMGQSNKFHINWNEVDEEEEDEEFVEEVIQKVPEQTQAEIRYIQKTQGPARVAAQELDVSEPTQDQYVPEPEQEDRYQEQAYNDTNRPQRAFRDNGFRGEDFARTTDYARGNDFGRGHEFGRRGGEGRGRGTFRGSYKGDTRGSRGGDRGGHRYSERPEHYGVERSGFREYDRSGYYGGDRGGAFRGSERGGFPAERGVFRGGDLGERGSFRGERGGYRGDRGGYRGNFRGERGAFRGESTRGRFSRDRDEGHFYHRNIAEEAPEEGRGQVMETGGFEVTKSRYDKPKDAPYPYSESRGPRTAQGAMRGHQTEYRGGFRGKGNFDRGAERGGRGGFFSRPFYQEQEQ